MSFKFSKKAKLMSPDALLEESKILQVFFITIAIITLIFLILLIWAGFAEVNETTVAYGQVEPQGKITIIQHLYGGTVQKVLVNNGEQVSKNQILVELDPSEANSKLKELKSRRTSIIFDMLRLQTFISGQSPDKELWKKFYQKYAPINESAWDKLFTNEIEVLNEQSKDRFNQKNILKTQIEKYQNELQKNIQAEKHQIKNLKLFREEMVMLKKLANKGYVSKRDILVTERKVTDAEAMLDNIHGKISMAKSDLTETKDRLAQLQSKLNDTALQEIDDLHTQLPEINAKIEDMAYRLKTLKIRAPFKGEVNALQIKAGNVIKPGEKLMELVPINDNLMITAQVSTQDIGNIHVDDPVKIKVLTFDFARFGGLDGKLTQISPNTFVNKDGKPFYKVQITPQKLYLASDPSKQIKTGMTVRAEIITGEKTILQYLLKPIYRAASSSFQER